MSNLVHQSHFVLAFKLCHQIHTPLQSKFMVISHEGLILISNHCKNLKKYGKPVSHLIDTNWEETTLKKHILLVCSVDKIVDAMPNP